ncbi:hypothetical protein [Variovorax sp. efr-133-TYG-130]|uniref:hypothetical protein n=1 Tax=Variovorax sp. efr-133-TYG-130 TaxID=3040327 RepID=UPI002556D9B6|nr:hypothetical protein [Variovorax sp. efr-133-TYG-130]
MKRIAISLSMLMPGLPALSQSSVTTYSTTKNKWAASFAAAGSPSGVAGRSSSGLQMGVTHRF